MQQGEIVFIALGSNLGERFAYLASGRRALAEVMSVEQVSGIYETPPWGLITQPPYLNQVVQGHSEVPAMELLRYLKSVETKTGRTAGVRYGPRVLDLDILFYGQQVLESETLQIPHPRIAERAFVLVPLSEIAPNWQHPVLKRSMVELLAVLPPQEGILRYDENQSAAVG
jgi:2-amino-4-hydroxy-6-hydroxymethyldihydropteridine diphosphokinase